MPRGGKRPGAGRKKGAATRKTRAIANAAAASGEVLPLEVMLTVMRRHYEAGNDTAAATIAAQAAPYVHPKLSSVQHGGQVGVQLEIVEEIVDSDSHATSSTK